MFPRQNYHLELKNIFASYSLNLQEMRSHMDSVLKVMKVRENARLPFRATKGSAGMDLYACIDEEKTLAPGELLMIPTGIAIELPSESFVAYVFARSGLGIKHGICLSNGVGVIDSDYRGEICVGLCNVSRESYTIAPFERIAQMVISPVSLMPVAECESLTDSVRGAGGFGSTGKG